MGTLAYCEDPDEMLHGAAFHQGLHFCLKVNLQREKCSIFGNDNLGGMGYPDFTQ